MVMVLSGLLFVAGIGSLVCWIMEIVTAFKKEQSPLMGILSIVLCSLGGFIIGWIKHKEWGIQQLMLIWTGLIIVSVVLNIASVFLVNM